ncbi:MAG TPA: 50S ribosomal protein L25, partial [Terriglobia bacterium]|nr:50S ribosomal protein L25 [Terriglobia bacterium]
AQGRADRGKNAARRLRAKGMIPAVVYGGKGDSVAVSVDPKTLLRVLRSEAGRNTILSLDLGDGGKTSAILKSWQVDPVDEKFIHADFYRIAMDVAIKVKVPILTKGEARGVKVDAGILEIIMREVEVECLPGDIPERIEVDVTDLGIHGALRVSDLKISDKVKILDEADQIVVHVVSVKEEVAPTAAAPVEGEAGAAPAAPAEPEVMKKGKKEEEPAE